MSDDEESNAPPSGAVHQIVPRLQSGPAQTTTSELAAGLSRWMDASNNFIYVELASLVLLFACVADWYPTVWHKYALSVACVSLLVCLILQTAEFLVPGFLQWSAVKQGDDGTGGHSIQKVCSVFMLLWWIFGAGIITFHAPFVVTSNGTTIMYYLILWTASYFLSTRLSITSTLNLLLPTHRLVRRLGRSSRHSKMVHRTQIFGLRRSTSRTQTTILHFYVLHHLAARFHPPACSKMGTLWRSRIFDSWLRAHNHCLRVYGDHVQ